MNNLPALFHRFHEAVRMIRTHGDLFRKTMSTDPGPAEALEEEEARPREAYLALVAEGIA